MLTLLTKRRSDASAFSCHIARPAPRAISPWNLPFPFRPPRLHRRQVIRIQTAPNRSARCPSYPRADGEMRHGGSRRGLPDRAWRCRSNPRPQQSATRRPASIQRRPQRAHALPRATAGPFPRQCGPPWQSATSRPGLRLPRLPRRGSHSMRARGDETCEPGLVTDLSHPQKRETDRLRFDCPISRSGAIAAWISTFIAVMGSAIASPPL